MLPSGSAGELTCYYSDLQLTFDTGQRKTLGSKQLLQFFDSQGFHLRDEERNICSLRGHRRGRKARPSLSLSFSNSFVQVFGTMQVVNFGVRLSKHRDGGEVGAQRRRATGP